jgi:aquaporin rerated protein, other eukaryote
LEISKLIEMNIGQIPTDRSLARPWKKVSYTITHYNLLICFQAVKDQTEKDDAEAAKRLTFLRYLPAGSRAHIVAILGEFIGTFLFLFFAYIGTEIAHTTSQSGSQTASTSIVVDLYVSLAFGFSLVVTAWNFFRVSGALFNPAITWGMCLVGALSWFRGGLLFIAQLLGALCAAAVVSALLPSTLNVGTQLLYNTTTSQGLFIEMFLTAQLVLTVFMLAAEKHKATYLAPVGM